MRRSGFPFFFYLLFFHTLDFYFVLLKENELKKWEGICIFSFLIKMREQIHRKNRLFLIIRCCFFFFVPPYEMFNYFFLLLVEQIVCGCTYSTVCVCVCVCERERERGRERGWLCELICLLSVWRLLYCFFRMRRSNCRGKLRLDESERTFRGFAEGDRHRGHRGEQRGSPIFFFFKDPVWAGSPSRTAETL